jgi:hypothetical protein
VRAKKEIARAPTEIKLGRAAASCSSLRYIVKSLASPWCGECKFALPYTFHFRFLTAISSITLFYSDLLRFSLLKNTPCDSSFVRNCSELVSAGAPVDVHLAVAHFRAHSFKRGRGVIHRLSDVFKDFESSDWLGRAGIAARRFAAILLQTLNDRALTREQQSKSHHGLIHEVS